jgi:hypothetical protein
MNVDTQFWNERDRRVGCKVRDPETYEGHEVWRIRIPLIFGTARLLKCLLGGCIRLHQVAVTGPLLDQFSLVSCSACSRRQSNCRVRIPLGLNLKTSLRRGFFLFSVLGLLGCLLASARSIDREALMASRRSVHVRETGRTAHLHDSIDERLRPKCRGLSREIGIGSNNHTATLTETDTCITIPLAPPAHDDFIPILEEGPRFACRKRKRLAAA